ncbi:MAG: DUF5320 domain-containing protein [Candidatus Erginobacter occultus]|nr:DUF5320 domain-containing protein [Candidatus Erginobacter occultus]
MPGFNGTGPSGAGPRTGGGFGYCAPAVGGAYPGGAAPYYGVGRGGYPRGGGRGRAWGGGRGRGYGYPAYPAYPPAYPPMPVGGPSSGEELDFLRYQEKGLREELDSISSRIGELEKESPPENE